MSDEPLLSGTNPSSIPDTLKPDQNPRCFDSDQLSSSILELKKSIFPPMSPEQIAASMTNSDPLSNRILELKKSIFASAPPSPLPPPAADAGNLLPAWATATPAEATEPPTGISTLPDRDAAPASTSGSPEGTKTTNPDDANISGSKEGTEFHLDRGWDQVKPPGHWWDPEKSAEIPISREELLRKFPQYGDKITGSVEEIKNGKPINADGEPFSVYDNAFDAAMASGYYMQKETGQNNEEMGTLVYPAPDGNGFVFVKPNSIKDPLHSVTTNSRQEWDKIDPNTRYKEVAHAHTHGTQSTSEGSMHRSPGDYEYPDPKNPPKIDYMINSTGEHRFFFPGKDDHVYVIKLQ
jgi:hypothetical protein